MQDIHFISGLPRAGSTLLSALLRQNPRFEAAMSSPVGGIFNACLAAMGPGNEFSLFLDEARKREILMGIFRGYYGEHGVGGERTVFDTNRMWTSRLPAVLRLFPEAKVICCVRDPAWVFDSMERLIRRNALDVSRVFNSDAERATVYSRAEALMQRSRLIGYALAALKEAYYSDEAPAMLLVDYNLLAARPLETLRLIYRFIDAPWFEHDVNDVRYASDDFDRQLMVRGMHRVEGRVELRERRTILPPDLFAQFSELAFWTRDHNTRAHLVVPRSAAVTRDA